MKMRWLLLIIAAILLLGGCLKPKAKPQTAAPANPPAVKEQKTPVQPKEFSPAAFLDESMYPVSSEKFFSPNGRMIKEAAYFGGTGKILALVTNFDLMRTDDSAGPLYLVDSEDAADVMQLKGANEVLNFVKEPTGGIYYHEVKQGEREAPPDAKAGGEVVPHSPVINSKVIPHYLNANGDDTVLDMENVFVDEVLPDGKLMLSQVVDLTAWAGGYVRGTTKKWSVYDPAQKKELHAFDYLPMLAPDLSTSFEVVRYYDAADYGKSFFALYEGALNVPSEQLKLVYSCPYYVTLTAERWWPAAQFIDAKHVLVSRFTPLEAPGVEQGAVPYNKGTLTLERLDVTTHQLRTLVTDVPPYIALYTQLDAPVFFYVSHQLADMGRKHNIWAAATDGTKARKLVENGVARRVRIMDVDFKAGKMLVSEDYETTAGSYSLLREYYLSVTPPPPEPPSVKEEPLPGKEAPKPAEGAGANEGPPPISMPGEKA
jgi:hypothetical protein